MNKIDKASLHYGIGLAALSILQMCMTHGLFQNPNRMKGQELIVDGADLTPYTELAAEAGNSLVSLMGAVVIFICCVILSAVVMLLLRLLLRDQFDERTAKRGLIFAGISAAVCFLAGLLFSGGHEASTVLILCLPVPVVSWLTYHIGRSPEPMQNPPVQAQEIRTGPENR